MVKKKLDEEAQSNPETREKNLKKRFKKKRFKKKRFKKKGQKRKRVFKSRKIGRLQKKLRIN